MNYSIPDELAFFLAAVAERKNVEEIEAYRKFLEEEPKAILLMLGIVTGGIGVN